MDSASVKEKVIEIVSEKLKKPKEQITLESSFQDLGADSLDTADLVMEFEDEFDINIPEEAEGKIKTVGEVVKFIEEQTKK
ncbi:MAG TPA: acyl carrier protein [Planctomycetota bacterium]|nr:acyl carrier protein [Planctomycetota bacterium]